MKRIRNSLLPAVMVLAGLFATNRVAHAQFDRVQGTPHNLSVSGMTGKHFPAYQSQTESRICVFCHTPHHSSGEGPLWSRGSELFTSDYTPYYSTTLKGRPTPGQPTGASRLCLSCHDGAIALGKLSPAYSLDLNVKITRDLVNPQLNTNLGTDLSDDHPISLMYDYERNSELNNPALLTGTGVKLANGVTVECTACHDPHNNQYGNFLVMNTAVQHDRLCTTCHNKAGWSDPDSTHRTGGARDPVLGPLVKADGCVSCHTVHTAPGPVHLLKSSVENSTCVAGSCHSAIQSLLLKPYAHRGNEGPAGTHRQDEGLPATQLHVVCVDCHNPHQAGYAGSPLGSAFPAVPPASQAPGVNGPLRGVRGVGPGGTIEIAPAAAEEYQICFRCHAATAGTFQSTGNRPVRQDDQLNQSIRFDMGNPSYHPVIGARKGTGRSLKETYKTMMKMYCSDCHDPHGSNEAHQLKAQNDENFPASGTTYPLCFGCHDSAFLLVPGPTAAVSQPMHKAHVEDHLGGTKRAPCSACHDPHGVTTNSHLINFNTIYTGANPIFNQAARSCTVSTPCHGTPGARTY